MNRKLKVLTIGEAATRAGVAASALRFYETRGLIKSVRGPGNQRQYHRSTLRRISIIKIAQSLGLSLGEIGKALDQLPEKRNPTRRDWEKLSTEWRIQLDQRIEALIELQEKLAGCIGCGCLSLDRCALYNPDDEMAKLGPGPRHLQVMDR